MDEMVCVCVYDVMGYSWLVVYYVVVQCTVVMVCVVGM